MAKKRSDEKYIIDTKGALLVLKQEKGISTTATKLADEAGRNKVTIVKWQEKAPMVIEYVCDLMEEFDLTFEQIVKKVKEV